MRKRWPRGWVPIRRRSRAKSISCCRRASAKSAFCRESTIGVVVESIEAALGMTGTTPPGAASEQEAARWVRGMFGRIAGRYDLLNHLLSFNLDRRWRARTVNRVAAVLERPDARVLDLCCGTGDVLLSMEARKKCAAFGSDFCHPMLVEAKREGCIAAVRIGRSDAAAAR